MATQIRFSVFQYDIPEITGFPNPTGYLRRRNRDGKVFAFRTQWSMWLVDRDNPPLALQARMEKAGCTVDLYPLDPAFNDQYLARAAKQMRNELMAQLKREEASLKKADDKLAEAEAEHAAGTIGWDALRKAQREHEAKRQAALGRTEELIRDLEAAAAQYNITAPTDAFASVRGRVAGLHAAASARAEMYVRLANEVKGTPIGAAALESEVPPGILADYAEEHGADATGFREMFRDEPTPPATLTRDRDTRTYRASRNGQVYQVTTDMTRREAAEVLAWTTDGFARKMATLARNDRYMSATQVAWLMILADRQVRHNRQAPATPATTVTPPTTPAPEATAPVATAPVATVEPAAATATIDQQATSPDGVLETGRMIWNGKERMLIVEFSTTGLTAMSKTIQVRNSQKGTIGTFTYHAENYDDSTEDNIPISYDYQGPGGVTLRILND